MSRNNLTSFNPGLAVIASEQSRCLWASRSVPGRSTRPAAVWEVSTGIHLPVSILRGGGERRASLPPRRPPPPQTGENRVGGGGAEGPAGRLPAATRRHAWGHGGGRGGRPLRLHLGPAEAGEGRGGRGRGPGAAGTPRLPAGVPGGGVWVGGAAVRHPRGSRRWGIPGQPSRTGTGEPQGMRLGSVPSFNSFFFFGTCLQS